MILCKLCLDIPLPCFQALCPVLSGAGQNVSSVSHSEAGRMSMRAWRAQVFQRQLAKEGLQQVVNSNAAAEGEGGGSVSAAAMSTDELRDLFQLRTATASDTFDSMCADDGSDVDIGDAPGRPRAPGGHLQGAGALSAILVTKFCGENHCEAQSLGGGAGQTLHCGMVCNVLHGFLQVVAWHGLRGLADAG